MYFGENNNNTFCEIHFRNSHGKEKKERKSNKIVFFYVQRCCIVWDLFIALFSRITESRLKKAKNQILFCTIHKYKLLIVVNALYPSNPCSPFMKLKRLFCVRNFNHMIIATFVVG